MEDKNELIAKTFQGLEEVLAQELTELGANDVQIGRRMVSFSGDKEMMYRANFCLRTAVRILKPIKHFKAKDADEVYNAVKAIDWTQYLDVRTSFAVDSVVFSTEFRHSKFVAYKVKDAIADFFREHTGERPNIRITNPDIRLNIHIAETDCTLSLDSSGESLHLRGYRTATVEAPINEVLAAAIVKLSGWKFDTDFIDPFCGSGTILIEAALMARNIYPGVFRKKFGFENWKDFDQDLLDRIYNDDSAEREFSHKIIGYDLNLRAVEAAIANSKMAGVANIVSVSQRDIHNFVAPEGKAIMITNPPYGERLQSTDTLSIYKTLGDKLKRLFTNGEAWIISSKEELFDAMRLRPSFRIPLQNGSIDCELRKYVTFDGTIKDFISQGGEVKTESERQRMGERNRFRSGRDRDFSRNSRRYDEEEEEFSDEYLALRKRHNNFERERNAKERREQGGFDRERRQRDDRSPYARRDDRRRDDDYRRDDRRNDRRRDDFRRGDRRNDRRWDDDRRGNYRDGYRNQRDDDRRGDFKQRGYRNDDQRDNMPRRGDRNDDYRKGRYE